LARSVEIMTHRPVMGSFLNSGKDSSWAKKQAWKTKPAKKLFYYSPTIAGLRTYLRFQSASKKRLCTGGQ
jgi:hypothetical protein